MIWSKATYKYKQGSASHNKPSNTLQPLQGTIQDPVIVNIWQQLVLLDKANRALSTQFLALRSKMRRCVIIQKAHRCWFSRCLLSVTVKRLTIFIVTKIQKEVDCITAD